MFTYPEHVVITDYKSSDVRDPAKARQRAKESLQLSIYAMGYEAMTGRLPDAVALSFLETGLVGTVAVDRKRIDKARESIRTAATGMRARDFTREAGPARLHLVRLPGDLPVQRGPLTHGAAVGRARGARCRRWPRPRAAPSSRPTTWTCWRRSRTGRVDLAYADPPFATGRPRRLVSIRTGSGERTRPGFRGPEVAYETVSDMAWDDDLPLDLHLEALGARIREIHRVLAAHGSLYLHVDWRTVHHVRLLLDEVFGPERFLNELVWAYDYGGRARDRWPRKHDTILWYAKGDSWLFDREAIDRIPYMAPGLVGPEKAARGKLPTDVWWMTIVPPASAERTGYPTQKPVRLLERIVAASSRPGDLVLDPFAGSGTTGVAAATAGPAVAAGGPQPGRRGDRAWAAGGRGGEGRARDPGDHPGLRQHAGPGVGRRAARRRARTRPRRWRPASARSTWTRCSGPGARSASASSARRCRSSARWTWRCGSCGSWPGCAGWRRLHRPPLGRRGRRPPVHAGRGGLGRGGVLAGLRGRAAARARRRGAAGAAGGGTGSGSCPTGRSPRPSTATWRLPAGRRTWPPSSSRSGSGTIKPHPAIFAAARTALGDPEPSAILHVGDDWAADVVGAKRAGWRAAWLASRPADSPCRARHGTTRPRWTWSWPRSTSWRRGSRACADRRCALEAAFPAASRTRRWRPRFPASDALGRRAGTAGPHATPAQRHPPGRLAGGPRGHRHR